MLNIRRETNVKLLLNIFNVLIMNLLEKKKTFGLNIVTLQKHHQEKYINF